jgi:hypothetical protein
MAEFLVGLPMMIVLWAGVEYFRTGFARRLDTMNLSHAEAWEKAYSNDGKCYAGNSGPWGGWSENNSQMPDGNGDGQGIDKNFDASMFMYGVSRSTKTESVSSSRFSASVKSGTTITCNEVVPKEDRNVLAPLVDFVKSFL